MAREIGQLKISLFVDLSKYSKGLNKASKQIKGFSKGLMKAGAGMTATGAVVGLGLRKVMQATMQQELAENRLLALLKNVRKERDFTIDSLKDQANALQNLTKFSNTEIMTAQAMLASFQMTKEQIEEATPRILDIASAVERTTGQQVDLQQVAIGVGKALDGNVGVLSRMGIVLSESTKKSKDFNSILADIDLNAKGVALSAGKTLGGSLTRVRNTFSDLMKTIGFELVPVMKKASEFIINVVNALKKMNPRLRKVIAVGLLVTPIILGIGGAFLTMAGAVGMGIGQITAFVAGNPAFIGALGTALVAVGALAVGVLLLHKYLKQAQELQNEIIKEEQSERAVERFGKLRTALEGHKKALADLGPRTAENAQEFDALSRQVELTTKALRGVRESTERVKNQFNETPGIMLAFQSTIEGVKNKVNELTTALGVDYQAPETPGAGGGVGGLPTLSSALANVAGGLRGMNDWAKEVKDGLENAIRPEVPETLRSIAEAGAEVNKSFEVGLVRTLGEMPEIGQQVGNFLVSSTRSLATALGNIMTGVSVKWKDIFKNILQAFVQMIMQMIAKAMMLKVLESFMPGVFGGAGPLGIAGALFRRFQEGGIVPGAIGQPQMVLAHGGEVIFNPKQMTELLATLRGAGGGRSYTIYAQDSESFVDFFRRRGPEALRLLEEEGRI